MIMTNWTRDLKQKEAVKGVNKAPNAQHKTDERSLVHRDS